MRQRTQYPGQRQPQVTFSRLDLVHAGIFIVFLILAQFALI